MLITSTSGLAPVREGGSNSGKKNATQRVNIDIATPQSFVQMEALRRQQ